MGHVREHRATRLLEDALLDWLEDGTIPTTGQLKEAFEARQQEFGDLSRSATSTASLPARYEESSASTYNSILDGVEHDFDVLLKALVDISNLSITTLGEWSSRGRALQARISKLQSRIEALLLMKSDTSGYVSFVEDNFASLEKVSSDTTALIDTLTGEVTLGVNRTEGVGQFQGTQIDLSDAEVSWGLIESSNVRYSSAPSGSALRNLTSDTLNRWGAEVETLPPDQFKTASSSGKAILGELKVKMQQEEEVSKIVLLSSDSAAGSNTVAGAQYSNDGYTWENVPSDSPVQSGVGNFIWRFKRTPMRWIKIIISKASPDKTTKRGAKYDFGLEQIKVYSESYVVEEDGVDLYTELLTPRIGGSDVTFGRAALEVCEEVPDETSLRYHIRAYDGSNYTSWVQVSPISRSSEAAPAVVDFSAPEELDSSTLTTSFNSSLDVEALNIMRADGASSLSYRFSGPDDTVANFYIGQNDNLLSDLTVLRNIGYSAGKYPTTDTDKKVADVECGWGLDGDSIYYCAFLVKRPEGLSIDFGPSQAVLDGRTISGLVRISSGWHTFRTDRANWGSLSGTVPTSSATLKAIDPLYPYNHKYLIEGYNYPSSWTGEKERVYLGVDQYGQHKANRVGRHAFNSSGLDTSIYSVDVISGPKTILLLKFDSSRPNHENERVRLFYTRRYDQFTGIQMRANLNTQNAGKTPILSGYRIKVK